MGPLPHPYDVHDQAANDATAIDWRSDDPFGIIRHLLPGELRQMCEIDDGDPVRDPLASRRAVFALSSGHLFLADVSGQEAVQIGQRVTFTDAGELATSVLLGASRAYTAPIVVHTLALAYMAALAEVERLRRLPRLVHIHDHAAALPAAARGA